MNWMFVLSIAVVLVPTFGIGWYIYRSDKYDKEPGWLLLLSFAWGALSVLPIYFIEGFLETSQGLSPEDGFGELAALSFGVIAFPEEFFKYIFLVLVIYSQKAFNEPLDGMVYAFFVALGFASAENIVYAYNHGIEITAFRMATALPAHIIFAGLMGFFLGRAKFNPKQRIVFLFLAFLFPWFAHGLYDFFLLQLFNEALMLTSLVILFVGSFFTIRAFRKQLKESPWK